MVGCMALSNTFYTQAVLQAVMRNRNSSTENSVSETSYHFASFHIAKISFIMLLLPGSFTFVSMLCLLTVLIKHIQNDSDKTILSH